MMQSAPAFCPPLSNSGPDKRIHQCCLYAWLKRRAWAQKYHHKTAEWWAANMDLVLDGVTLTTPPELGALFSADD